MDQSHPSHPLTIYWLIGPAWIELVWRAPEDHSFEVVAETRGGLFHIVVA